MAIGCGPVIAGDDAGSSSDSTADSGSSNPGTTNPGTTDTPGTTSTPGTSGTSTTTTADTSTSTTSVDEVTTNDEGPFLIDPDVEGLQVECDQWKQDCPDGEKCMPWANDGGGSWNSTRCTPLDPNPADIGEPCNVEGSGLSGIDNCDIRAMCFFVDPETNMGECVPFCEGSPNEPSCADDCSRCTLTGDGVLILCLPECDPLAQDCDEGRMCHPLNDSFSCIDAPEAGGAVGDDCEYYGCAAGNFCAEAEYVPGCETEACCTPFCDTQDPVACDVLPGAECTPWFAAPPKDSCVPGVVGVCSTPQ